MKKLDLQNKDIPLLLTIFYRWRIRESDTSNNWLQYFNYQEETFQLRGCEHFQETFVEDSTDKFLGKNEVRTSENMKFQSDSGIDEDCPN